MVGLKSESDKRLESSRALLVASRGRRRGERLPGLKRPS